MSERINIIFDFFFVVLFQAKGASICDVYIVSSSAFHDRRIPVPVSALLYDLPSKAVVFSEQFLCCLLVCSGP